MQNEFSFSTYSVSKKWCEFLFSWWFVSGAQRVHYGKFVDRLWSLETDDSRSCWLLSQVHGARYQQCWAQGMASLCKLWLWALLHQPSDPKNGVEGVSASLACWLWHFSNSLLMCKYDLMPHKLSGLMTNPKLQCKSLHGREHQGTSWDALFLISKCDLRKFKCFSKVRRYNEFHPVASENWPEPFHEL